jgi:hydrogenase-4 component H
LSNNYDAASYEKSQMTISVEKRLLACDSCGSIVGAKDHLLFLAKKLGPLAYANPVLILANQAELKLGEYSLSSSSSYRPAAGRTIMFKVLCPNCRRLVILEDEKTDCQHL